MDDVLVILVTTLLAYGLGSYTGYWSGRATERELWEYRRIWWYRRWWQDENENND